MESSLFDSGFPIKIGNQEFTASMFTDKDYGDLDEYIKKKYIAIAMKQNDELSDEQRKELISIALKEVISNPDIGWATDVGWDIIYSHDGEGILHLGFQMCRKRHPDLTYAKFKRYAGSGETLANAAQEIDTAFKRLNLSIVAEDVGGSSTVNSKSE